MIYLDNNATTMVSPEVIKEMIPFFSSTYGNPSSKHAFGRISKDQVEIARQKISYFLNCNPEELIFTSCGTESNNSAINSALTLYPQKRDVIISQTEHPSILNYCLQLQKKGYHIYFIPVNKNGSINLKKLEKYITNNTAIISVMWANNETGIINPIEKIRRITKQKVLLHTDAVQVAGKIPININKINVDMLSISGHKFHAPKGIGLLYIRKTIPFAPYLKGGHQELNRRAGTENVPYIIGLAKACELARLHMNKRTQKISYLKNKLEEGLSKIRGSKIHGKLENRLPNTTLISFKNMKNQKILEYLSAAKIYVSSGTSCITDNTNANHTLQSMNIPSNLANGTIRISLSFYNTEEDIDHIVKHITTYCKKKQNNI